MYRVRLEPRPSTSRFLASSWRGRGAAPQETQEAEEHAGARTQRDLLWDLQLGPSSPRPQAGVALAGPRGTTPHSDSRGAGALFRFQIQFGTGSHLDDILRDLRSVSRLETALDVHACTNRALSSRGRLAPGTRSRAEGVARVRERSRARGRAAEARAPLRAACS